MARKPKMKLADVIEFIRRADADELIILRAVIQAIIVQEVEPVTALTEPSV